MGRIAKISIVFTMTMKMWMSAPEVANVSRDALANAWYAPQTRSHDEAAKGEYYALAELSLSSSGNRRDDAWVASLIQRSFLSFLYHRFRATNILNKTHFVEYSSEFKNPLTKGFNTNRLPTFEPKQALIRQGGGEEASLLLGAGLLYTDEGYPMKNSDQLGG